MTLSATYSQEGGGIRKGSTPKLIHLCKWVWVRAYKRRDLYPRGPITGIEKALRNKMCTVEPRFNEPLCNVVLGITNDFLQPGQNYSKMYGTEHQFNEILFMTNLIQKCKRKFCLDITNKRKHVIKDECQTDQQG